VARPSADLAGGAVLGVDGLARKAHEAVVIVEIRVRQLVAILVYDQISDG
jgi:hypothetical protein